MIHLEAIQNAAQRIKGVVVNTPMAYAPVLSTMVGANIYLKKENLQRTGAFKLRGAFNKLATLTQEQKARGVVAASAGNHAQGVAFSAKHFEVNATIVMPQSTPLTKINGVTEFGATVVLHGSNYDEAYAHARELEAKYHYTFVHPFEDAEVMAGQGTIALEMLESMPDLDVLVVPMGGGGLISGMASAAKQLKPSLRVIGVSAYGASGLRQSFEAGTNQGPKPVRTIADGIAVRDTSDVTLGHMLECVDAVVSVDDNEIASAILFLLERQKLLVEGAGAVGVAAVMHNKIALLPHQNIGVVLSGGNIDVTMLSVIIEKGLVKSSRKMKLVVTLIDKPGSLMHLTQILAQNSANIVHIGYDRTSTSLAYGDANVNIEVETKGDEHQTAIAQSLTSHGYKFTQQQ
ncbi:MAG: threonine dehydratase [Sulfuricurvum sp. PC08-66]|nr:MAG: threonine dehydratase [Sulfuricurvum sp. PC08-66]